MNKTPGITTEIYSLKAISTKQWWLLIVLILLFVGGYMGFEHRLGYRYDMGRISDDTILYYILHLLEANPGSLKHTFFGNYHFPTLAFVTLLGPLVDTMGLVNTLITVEAITGIGYIVCTFAVLYMLTGTIWLALTVAIFSVFPVLVFPVESWAILSFPSVLPRTVVSIVYPALLYGWLQLRQSPKRLLGIFFLIGFVSNIHPLTGLTLVSALLLAQVTLDRFSIKSIGFAALCGLAALIPIIPFALDFNAYTSHSNPTPLAINPTELQKAFDYRLGFPGFSVKQIAELFSPLPWLVLGILGLCSTKHPYRRNLLFFIGATLFIFGFVIALNDWIIIPQGKPPFLLVDFLRAPRQLILPLVMLSALYIANRPGTKQKIWLTVVLGLSIILIDFRTLASDIGSHAKLSQIVPHQIQSKKKEYSLNNKMQRKAWKKYDMYDAAMWLKQNTPQNQTLVHVSPIQQNNATIYILAFGHRAVTLDWNFFGTLYYIDKPEFIRWYQLFSQLNAISKEKGSCSVEELQVITRHYPKLTHLVCSIPVSKTTNSSQRV